MNNHQAPAILVAMFAAVLPLAACDVDVRREEQGSNGAVDIRTPIGDLSVRSDVDAADTGLPLYPGARLLRDGGEPESARVNISNSLFGVKVVAATFESADPQEKIVAFYRDAMTKAYGMVTECRGDVEFEGKQPVCTENASSEEVQLVTGTEENQRVVAVKPRGNGSELALVHVQTRG